MKNFVLMILAIMLASCAGSVQHPEFENNVKLGQQFFQLHGEENFDAMVDMLHDDLQWTSPKYGEGMVNKETQLGYIKMYQDLYDNINFEANYWLPGVDTLSLQNDGSIRVYGSWTGVHTETGNDKGTYASICYPCRHILYGAFRCCLDAVEVRFDVARDMSWRCRPKWASSK